MNLLSEEMQNYVLPTSLTRKLTLDGETKAYPVYKVKLEALFFNDQNDRISTWISRYKSENGENAFRCLTQEEYNSVIEGFIVESNPASIEKTQMNIELVNQREPGVVLSDGRIIDGNRRFTCLRRLAVDKPEFGWFETVILDIRMKNSKKQIKMLELNIQHGEEKKVDYNPIDRLVGVYQDIMKTQLLTIEEYAASTNETTAEVKKRMEQAQLLIDFLDYVHMPEQYYIAREYQVVSVFTDMMPLLKKCKNDADRAAVKEIVFNNILMQTIGDSRKYIRNLSSMIDTGIYAAYIKHQLQISEELKERLSEAMPKTLAEMYEFVRSNPDIAEDLRNATDSSLLKAKKRETKARPSQSVSKSITMLKDVDTRIFSTLNEKEKENLSEKIDQLSARISVIREELTGKSDNQEDTPFSKPKSTETISVAVVQNQPVVQVSDKNGFKIAVRHIDEPILHCIDMNKPITNLSFGLNLRLDEALVFQKSEVTFELFFIDEQNNIVTEVKRISVQSGQTMQCHFTLHSEVSKQKICYLAIRSAQDLPDALQQMIPFKIRMNFTANFGF